MSKVPAARVSKGVGDLVRTIMLEHDLRLGMASIPTMEPELGLQPEDWSQEDLNVALAVFSETVRQISELVEYDTTTEFDKLNDEQLAAIEQRATTWHASQVFLAKERRVRKAQKEAMNDGNT